MTVNVTPVNDERLRGILATVKAEVRRAANNHAALHSSHEGYSVILEEVDELWDEVRRKRANRSLQRMREECIQIAATAVRFIHDLIPPEGA